MLTKEDTQLQFWYTNFNFNILNHISSHYSPTKFFVIVC